MPSPTDGRPHPFVQIIPDDLRREFEAGDRTRDFKSASHEPADHESVDRSQGTPADGLQDRPCMCLGSAESQAGNLLIRRPFNRHTCRIFLPLRIPDGQVAGSAPPCVNGLKNPLMHLIDSDLSEGRAPNCYDKAEAEMRVPLALVVLCAVTQSALAQGTEECRSIPDRTARLACYDREAPPLTSRTPSQTTPARTAPAPKADSSKYMDSPGADDELVNARMNNICRGC